MRQYLIILAMLISFCMSVQGQDVVFNTLEWDFGTILESDGGLEHDFLFRNASSSPLRIGSVSVSCSCVRASFPHTEIPSGATGKITLYFGPEGAAGKTLRYADVYSSAGKHLGRLSMNAEVIPIDRDVEERFHTVISPTLRSSRATLPFGYVRKGKTSSKELYLANLSDRTIRVETSSSSLSVEGPSEIPPHGEVAIRISYTPTQENVTHKENLFFIVDSVKSDKPVEVSAICLGNSTTANSSLFTSTSLATLKRGRAEIVLANEGREDLVIHGVEVPEGVDVNIGNGDTLLPGQKVKMKVKSQLESFEIHIFTNDPQRPYKELRFKK